ncbi:MAG: SAM-dependent methyltransferase [Magnetococcales bacterium]|nr:SAM-dependent methyltransferase [Magnetococcales bacterium]
MEHFIKKLIEKSGGIIPFERYMSEVLYNPDQGYYCVPKKRIGPGGDFVTSPEITSLFGELLALQMIELWQLMGSPATFQLIEVGPGSGRLACDLLHTAKRFTAFYCAVEYGLVEISPDFRSIQQTNLNQVGVLDKVRWYRDIQELAKPGVVGVIFGNEFLDALPVHRVEMTERGLEELGVKWVEGSDDSGHFEPAHLPLSKEIDPDYFKIRNVELAMGTRTEIGLAGQRWIERCGQVLKQGMILMIDYGHPQSEYYAAVRTQGTLAGHLCQVRVDNPLSHAGEMDLTAHVDFSAILAAGRKSGLHLLGYTTQGWFLMGLGILERLEMISKRDETRLNAAKEAVMRLILPEGMGEVFKVMALGRGLQGASMSGFRLNEQSHRL